MVDFDLDILFKQTTSENVKCKFCRKSLNGADGYIKMTVYAKQDRMWGAIEKRVAICNKCFKRWLDGITIASENKEEAYKKLVKNKILKSLNKNGKER